MRTVLAIARHAIAGAVRSRVVATLIGLLLVTMVSLPLMLKSDGTLTGHVRIVLGYTLGLASFLLALATLWAGSAALSVEIQDKQAHLLLTKPVRKVQIWLGKWFGLLALNAVLLTFCGLVLCGMLWWTIRPDTLSEEDRHRLHGEVLAALTTHGPALQGLDEAVDQRVQALLASGEVDPHISETAIRKKVHAAMLRSRYLVPEGEERTWLFDLPRPLDGDRDVLVSYRFDPSRPAGLEITGQWRVKPVGPVEPYRVQSRLSTGKRTAVRVPANVVAGASQIEVTYMNEPGDESGAALFDPRDGLVLRTYEGGFVGNLFRALLIVYARLALLAALGLTAGFMLSTPVALFTSLVVAILLQCPGYVESVASGAFMFEGHSHGDHVHEGAGLWDLFVQGLFHAFNVILKPLQDPHVLGLLGDAERIPWLAAGRALLVKMVVYSGLLAVLGVRILNRREIGLPS